MTTTISNAFRKWSALEIAWLFIANVFILSLSLYWQDSWLGILSGMAGVTSVILVAKRMIANYAFGIFQVTTYAWLAYQAQLFGEVQLNLLYFLPANIIGWIVWSRMDTPMYEEGTVKAKFLSMRGRLIWLVVSVASIIAYAQFLQSLGGNHVYLDSTSTVLSVLAMVLMIKAFAEQWVLWIVVNIVSIVMWAFTLQDGTGDVATLLMWVVFLINSIFGLVSWAKDARK